MNDPLSDDPRLIARICALQPVLRRAGLRMTGCPHTAEDLSQDAILKILQRLQAGWEPDNLRAYALTTLRNLARSRWRRMRPTDPLTEDVAITGPDAPARIELAEIRDAITHLPPQQARLMSLVAEGETSPAVLARRTGQPLGTVMSRLSRARAALKEATT